MVCQKFKKQTNIAKIKNDYGWLPNINKKDIKFSNKISLYKVIIEIIKDNMRNIKKEIRRKDKDQDQDKRKNKK